MRRRPVRRRAAAVALAALLLAVLAGCRPGGVVLTFRPDAGARYSYRIEVASSSVVTVPGQRPEQEDDRVVLRADHEVLSHGPRGTRVEVRLSPSEGGDGDDERRFVVTLDRSARLAAVERVENIPAEALGELGLSEIFPSAAGAPPDRRLRPGERWTIDEEVKLPGGEPGHLRGHGRVTELRVVGGIDAALVTTDVTLTLERRPGSRLAGMQRTTSRSIHAVADGAVISSIAETTGDFTVEVAPPEGRDGAVTAHLSVDVSSHTTLAS